MVRVVFIRHGETHFNVEKKTMKELIPDSKERTQYYLGLRDFDFIDGELSPQGVEETKKAAQDNKETLAKVKWVIVSPMIRTLHTASLLFDFANLKPGVHIVVHPAIRTNLTTVYNALHKYLTRAGPYAKLDWTLVDQRLRQFGWGWFTQELHTDQHRKALGRITAENSGQPLEKQVFAVLDYMQKNGPEFCENPKEKFLKLAEFELWLAKFIEEHGIQDDELAIVGHKSVFKLLLATEINEEFLATKTKKMDNSDFDFVEVEDTYLFKWAQSAEGKKQLADTCKRLEKGWESEGRIHLGAPCCFKLPVPPKVFLKPVLPPQENPAPVNSPAPTETPIADPGLTNTF